MYSWTGLGLSSATGAFVVARPTAAGTTTYTVTGSVNGCAGNTATLNVPVTAVTAKPILIKVLPTEGAPEGAEVVISGANLLGATVRLNGMTATVLLMTESELTLRVPVGATTGLLTVTTAAGTNEAPPVFKVTPFIRDLQPRSGMVGITITITGTGFTELIGVWVGGQPAVSYVVHSPTWITAIIAPGTTSGSVMVKTPSGTYRTDLMFSVMTLLKTPEGAVAELTIQPNPARDQIFVSGLPFGQLLYLLDVTGRVVVKAEAPTSGTVILGVRKLAAGTYTLRTGTTVKRIVVVAE